MSSLQLSFTLRTSPNCRTVHLLGSWDGYQGQLPMSKDSSSSKSGAWRGTFRFSGSTMQQGQRYWYYYIIDGYHVSHDPAVSSVVEPTTGRSLNVLDVPASKSSSSSSSSSRHSKRSSRPESIAVANGRGLSPSKIVSPRPTRPHATQHVGKDARAVDALSRQLASTHVSDSSFSSSDSDVDSSSEIDSDVSSDLPSLSSGSRSPASSMSSGSRASSRGSQCSCNRYGLTRKGERVKVDCGGRDCGYSDESEEEYYLRSGHDRRRGVVVRGSHSYRR